MKTSRRIVSLCVLVLFVVLCLLPQRGLSAQGAGQVILDYSFGNPKVEDGIQQPYKIVRIPELDILSIPGRPMLPFRTVKILIPYGQVVSDVEVVPGNRSYLGKFYIQPGQEAIPIDGDEPEPTPPDPSIYGSTKPYPETPFSRVAVQWKRGFQILILNLYPLEYIPKSMDVSWFSSLTVSVRTERAEKRDVGLYRGLARDKELLSALADNPEQVSRYPSTGSLVSASSILDGAYDYVIITNEALRNASEPNFQTLADWKASRGIKAAIVTVEDIYANYIGKDNQEKIRNFIRDAYLNNGIEYVLLGGDADGEDVGGESGDNLVPVRGLWAWDYETNPPNVPSDLYYACLDGSYDYDGDGIYGEPNDGPDGGEVDLMAEVYVGRAPVDTGQELSNFVSKTVAYEQSNGDAYLEEAWMVGELLWEEGGCALEEAVTRSDVADRESLLRLLGNFRDVALNGEYVELYYEYSPDIKRILIEEPSLSVSLVELLIRYESVIRYILGDPSGTDLKVTQADVDQVITFVEDLEDAIKNREDRIGAPRVAQIIGLLDEFEGEAHKAVGTYISEVFKNSIYAGLDGGAELAGETWGGDYKDEIKYGSCHYGYCTEGFPELYNVQALYDRDYDGHDWPTSEIIDIINGDVHLINHLGHSGVDYVMKMSNDDADALANSKYFFGYSQGCYAGSFDNREAPPPYGYGSYLPYDCIAEHLVTNPTGAFAVIANSRFGWGQKKSTDGPSQYYDRQFWDAVFSERIANLGKANQDSKEDNIGHISSGVMRFCYYEINLLGDPETPLFDLRPQYEHDIAVTDMKMPQKTEPGESIVVQAMVANTGKSDESNVQIELLQDGVTKETATIGALPVGSSYNMQFVWVSDVEGEYTLRVQALPVDGEEYIDNNHKESIIKVGEVVLVDDDGRQCPGADYTSVQAAIEGASDGDSISVCPGAYHSFVVNKQVTLIGIDTPVVDGQRNGNVVEIQADNVTLEGFRITNSGEDNNAGVLVKSSHSVVTSNIIHSSQCGVFLNAASNNRVSDNHVSANECGIAIETSSSNNDVLSNKVFSNKYGIYGYASSSAVPPYVLPNRISLNSLVDNEVNAHDDMVEGNVWNKNYWDDYTGEDTDGDGVGDTPYEIPGEAGATDDNPLMEPAGFKIYLPLIIKSY